MSKLLTTSLVYWQVRELLAGSGKSAQKKLPAKKSPSLTVTKANSSTEAVATAANDTAAPSGAAAAAAEAEPAAEGAEADSAVAETVGSPSPCLQAATAPPQPVKAAVTQEGLLGRLLAECDALTAEEAATPPPTLRPLRQADFDAARLDVVPSVSDGSAVRQISSYCCMHAPLSNQLQATATLVTGTRAARQPLCGRNSVMPRLKASRLQGQCCFG